MKCPKCGSEKTHYVANTKSTGPSFVDGCCGWILLGPVGLLCSFCGMGSETEEYWICDNCGSKFQAGEYESKLQGKEQEVQRLKRNIKDLEKALENKPEDLEEKLKIAKEEYEVLQEEYEAEDGNFIQSSKLLKRITLLYAVIILIARGGVIVSIGSVIWGIVKDAFTKGLLIGIGVFAVSLITFSIAEWGYKKIRYSINEDRALELADLKSTVEQKKMEYKELEKIQNNVKKLNETAKELEVKEEKLNQYKGE